MDVNKWWKHAKQQLTPHAATTLELKAQIKGTQNVVDAVSYVSYVSYAVSS